MQIDILWVRENFTRFNADYFGGTLPTPRFVVGRSRTRLGTCSWKRKAGFMRTVYSNFTITLSNYYDLKEHEFQSVLLHEMIHLSIAHNGVHDSSPHGTVFRAMMDRLNSYGWDIRVSHSTRGMEKAYTGSDRVVKTYLVAAIKTSNGKLFLSRVNPRYALKLDEMMANSKAVVSHAWYTTDDRWFEDHAEVRSLRGHVVSADVFQKKVEAMTPFTLPEI